MELYVIHDCTHVSVVTIPWGLYIYDDPSISDGCIHALDLRLQMILLHWMDVPMPWIFSYSPYYLDGCIHTVDSCFDIRYVYVYMSLICRSTDSVCPRPCKRS